jgi:hypothetical protein
VLDRRAGQRDDLRGPDRRRDLAQRGLARLPPARRACSRPTSP